MGLPDDEVQDILFAALLHDIGKIALPDALLQTPYDELNANQRREFEKHPLLGQATLVALEPLHGAANIILAHHELFNGQGYPNRLQGTKIPLGARILAVVDDYNILLTGGLFNHCHSPTEAKAFLQKERNKRYDPQVVDHFIQLLDSAKPNSQIVTEQCLKSADLKDGMVLTRDLLTSNSLLLLSKGHLLNDELITKISQLEKAADYDLSFYVQSY
jgi:response regulator RpfG family c-di-GMP phosphodiesterase